MKHINQHSSPQKANPAPAKSAALADDSKARLLKAAAAEAGKVPAQLQSNEEKGLDDAAAGKARGQYGENKVSHKKTNSTARQLIGAFINPFTAVLFVLAGISLFTNVIAAAPGQKDPWSVLIIVVMVLISGILRFVQESRSGKAAEKLSQMVQTTILVRRNGQDSERPIDQLVCGDIVHLAAGDMVPADLRILQAKDLFVNQSSLTGESAPVEKFPHAVDTTGKDALGLDNLAFMGSNITSGTATAIVVNVGNSTYFGALAQTLQQKPPPTSFEKGLNKISWVLIRVMLVTVPVVFVLNGLHTGNWMNALLFALSVAVGLTPAMLPTVVTTGLARGAVQLSHKKVIVKSLNSIQNFGSMDILCTDKTGTLTQDRVSLMNALDTDGRDSESAALYGALNSSFQSGLKNLMDTAILDFAGKHNVTDRLKDYTKVDEIPFDFERRRMSVVVQQNAARLLITKGAVEEILGCCTSYGSLQSLTPLDDAARKRLLQKSEDYNHDGLRVLALAVKNADANQKAFDPADEKGLCLTGFLTFLDPPKDSAAKAVAALHEYGVGVKILTGDNEAVTAAVCKRVGIQVDNMLNGDDVDGMDDDALAVQAEKTAVFAKLNPGQKSRVVKALRSKGHTVGYMGDGINDASSMKQADVGISVDTAVDIAKESADIILLDKDLMVLQQGIIEGRKTYANVIKYIKITVSSNFGNIFSVLAASIFLPFLPMLPLQLLVLNLIYDVSCMGLPWDNVEPDYLKAPRSWEAKSLKQFMLWFGPTSSVFDATTFLAMYLWLCPLVLGGLYKSLGTAQQSNFAALFQTGWFVMSLWTQTLILHTLRTPKIPFVQSRASKGVMLCTLAGILVGTVLPYTFVGRAIGLVPLPAVFYLLLAATVVGYTLLTSLVKRVYVKKYGQLL